MILLLESLHADAERVLAQCAPLVRASDPNAPERDLADFTAVRAILTRGRGRITAPLIDRCPALRAVARAGTGLDNVDTAHAKARGIPVVYAPGANAATVAEHTIALILDLARGITRTAKLVSAGRWEERKHFHGHELAGLRLGLVGCGNIGKRVAALARAFGMEVFRAERGADGTSNTSAASTASAALDLPPALPLAELLATSDAVSLHVPLSSATRHMIGARELAAMKPGAYLVNTARGELIDGAALRAALAANQLGGFAADVLEQEPPAADDPLLSHERVVLTPHVGALTERTYRLACLFTAENVVRVLRGETPEPRSILR
jgi:phosphoglycerate dehydrogenase-like enzyme